MATGARRRATLDFGRLREGLRGPGADTRVWVALARIDDDPDAIRWGQDDEAGLGWIVDVTFLGGPLDGEGPVPCRLGWTFGSDGAGRSDPPAGGCEVLVAIPEGDPNGSPTVIGFPPNQDGCQAPAEVNGETIDEALAKAAHIFRTPHRVEEQVDGDIRRASAAAHRLHGQLVELAEQDAGQSFVRGDDQQQSLDSFLGSLSTWAAEVGAALDGIGAEPPSQSTFIAGIETLQTQLQQALSDRIKGE